MVWTSWVLESDGRHKFTVEHNATQAWLLAQAGNYISYPKHPFDGLRDIRVITWGAVPELTAAGTPTNGQVTTAEHYLADHQGVKPKKHFTRGVLLSYAEGYDLDSGGRLWLGLVARGNGSYTVLSSEDETMPTVVAPGDFVGYRVYPNGLTGKKYIQMFTRAAVPMNSPVP